MPILFFRSVPQLRAKHCGGRLQAEVYVQPHQAVILEFREAVKPQQTPVFIALSQAGQIHKAWLNRSMGRPREKACWFHVIKMLCWKGLKGSWVNGTAS